MFLSFCVLDDFFCFKQFGFLGILGPPANHASHWIRDLWSKGVLLFLAFFLMFLSFCVLDNFLRFSKKLGFGVFFVHPTVVSLLYPHRSRDALSPVCRIFCNGSRFNFH